MPLTELQVQSVLDTVAGVENTTWQQLESPLLVIAKPRASSRLGIDVGDVQDEQIIDDDLFCGRYGLSAIKRLLAKVYILRKEAGQILLQSKIKAIDLTECTIIDDGTCYHLMGVPSE